MDRVDAATGRIDCTQANFDRGFVREKGVVLLSDKETRWWKDRKPAKFADVKMGDRLRTKMHGVGKGLVELSRTALNGPSRRRGNVPAGT